MSRVDRIRTACYASPLWIASTIGWATLHWAVAVWFALSLALWGAAWISEGAA